jgi:hypothetical protein
LPVAAVTVISKFQHIVWKISLLPVATVTVTYIFSLYALQY